MMTSDTRRFKSTEELAFANIGGEMPQSLPQDRYGTVEGAQRKLLQRQIDQLIWARSPTPADLIREWQRQLADSERGRCRTCARNG